MKLPQHQLHQISGLHSAKSGIFVILADFPIHSATQIRGIPEILSVQNGHQPSQVYHQGTVEAGL